jgi:prepilin-type N-terminal cleavage/methylation domain-containing protein
MLTVNQTAGMQRALGRGQFMPFHLRLAGFTLVELLAVVAIISLLIALLVPAVQSAREAARRIQCANNIKQVSTGLLNYHQSQSRFPTGQEVRIDDPTNYWGFWERWSWYHHVLAHVEQTALYDAYQNHFVAPVTRGSWSYEHCPQRDVPVGTFMCPTQPGSIKNANGSTITNQQGFHGSYVLNAGSTSFNPGGHAASTALNGLFMAIRSTSVDHIRDGSSNTLLASELILVPDGPVGPNSEQDLRGRYHNVKHAGALFSTLNPPNSSLPDRLAFCITTKDAPCVMSTTNVVVSARSFHVSGVNTSRADGSVHFVSDSVDDVVYRAMGSRSGGETTSGESF